MADKAIQDQTDRRLLMLENQSLRAGLASPLTRDHVNSFLFQPDEVYQAQLDRIIASEINRQNDAEQKLREKIERENKIKADEQAAHQAAQLEASKPAEQPRPIPEPVQQPAPLPEIPKQSTHQEVAAPVQPTPVDYNETVTCFIVCSFELQVDPRAPEEVIRKKFLEKMTAAGFQSLVSVRVQKQKAAA
jgi:hypothetical protein